MKTQFDILKNTRRMIGLIISNLTLKQMHTIPEGFKNNIMWNVVHLVATQQLLHYRNCAKECLVPEWIITKYKKGTFPEEEMSKELFDSTLKMFYDLPNQVEDHFNQGFFDTYTAYKTSTGFVINSIEEAISFNNFHEALHMGIIMSQKKLVQ